tara:strand:+ start:799 stop:2064 length:1266 start_codon:yes stop_codon:yes gene_type:complete
MKKYERLAIYGGKKTITKTFKKHQSIGLDEIRATVKTLRSGVLSGFVAGKTKSFYGGRNVQNFEKKICKYFNVKYAITVNSWTSGLITAIGACNFEPGDEIIVSPFTMVACATAILHWNLIPVFADIDKENFCLDPNSVRKLISKRTKAIMIIDINGFPAPIEKFKILAKKFNLKLIIDAAQSIGAKYKGKYTGTYGDIGGYSLNVHKHINTGEGGIIVTNNKSLARRCYLIRNHGEILMTNNSKVKELTNIIGYNFRMGEIEAALGIEQLKKLKKIIRKYQILAARLIKGIEHLEGLQVPKLSKYFSHSFYAFPMVLDLKKLKTNRKKIINTLRAEGVPVGEGYMNIHKLPTFEKKIAYGSNNFPWNLNKKQMDYRNVCKNAEELHNKTYFSFGIASYSLTIKDIDLVIKAFKKVWKNFH